MAPPKALVCTAVSTDCPVEASIYGYYPSLPVNAFFCAFFALLLIAQFFQGYRCKSWTYMIALTLGCLTEAIGYVGRILLHSNPFSSAGFEMQICCLIIAPAFLAAGVYLTLKHITLALGPEFSHLRPKFYTWIFICCDLFSLILQGAGGGIAASSNDDPSKQNIGNDLMLSGIAWQVVTLIVFIGFASDFFLRMYRNRHRLTPAASALLADPKFKLFLCALFTATLTIFTRCVFRIAEMANGWSNPIMQSQIKFIILDGAMCAIAALALTVFHPGYCFPYMQRYHQKNFSEKRDSTEIVSDSELGVPSR